MGMLWVGGASGETPDFVAPKFGEPEGIVRSGRDFAAVAAGWQRELADLASRGDAPDLCASKPEGTVRSDCDVTRLVVGWQRELADLSSRRDAPDLAALSSVHRGVSTRVGAGRTGCGADRAVVGR